MAGSSGSIGIVAHGLLDDENALWPLLFSAAEGVERQASSAAGAEENRV